MIRPSAVLCVLVLGCEPEVVGDRSDLYVQLGNAFFEVDRSQPSEPAFAGFDVGFGIEGVLVPTTVRVTRLELRGVSDAVLEGVSVRFLVESELADTVDVPIAGAGFTALLSGLDNERGAVLCGGRIEATIWFQSTNCECETEATFQVEPHCVLDNRAADLLSIPRGRAADRPCGSALEAVGSTTIERYGYDSNGRLDIVDTYFDEMHRQRTVFRYGAAGLLDHALSLDPTSGTIYVRSAWFYAPDGTLDRVERDGWVDEGAHDPDGIADEIGWYTLATDRWTLVVEGALSGMRRSSELTFDLPAHTFETEDDSIVTTYAYDASVSDPHTFVALPLLERILRLVVTSGMSDRGDQIEYSWEGPRLMSASVTNGSRQATTTFDFACP